MTSSDDLFPDESDKGFSLNHKLLIYFLLIAIVPLSILTYFNYSYSVDTQKNKAFTHLEDLTKVNQKFIDNWFYYREVDISIYSRSRINANLLSSLIEGYQSSGQSLHEFVKSYPWEIIVNDNKDELVNIHHEYDYIDDIYLIDGNGNVLFSVAKKIDLGENLYSGFLKNTKLTKAVQRSYKTGKLSFSDTERYVASNDEVSGFITAPLLDEDGNKLGVIAIQLRLSRLFELINDTNKSSSHVTQFLVGEDGYLRTPVSGNLNDELRNNYINKENLKPIDGLGENVTFFERIDLNGNVIISQYYLLKVMNVTWILVSEVHLSDVISLVVKQGYVSLAVVFITIFFVIIIAMIISRRITTPISALVVASNKVSSGDMDQEINVDSNDEIGRLASSFKHMLQMRRMHEASLEQANAQAKEALDELKYQKFALDQHSIVAVTDVKGTITYVNNKFCEISGYSKEELIGQNHRLLKSGFHSDDFFRNMYLSISKGNVWTGEICNKDKKGNIYWVDSTFVPYMGENGKPESYTAIRTDITQRKLDDAELLASKKAAEEAARAKSEFLACMSHEIRTPMNGVLGMLSLLMTSKLDVEQLHRASVARESAKSLLTVINDILDFSKIDAGKMELEILNFDLLKMLDDFCESFALLAESNEIELILDVSNVKQPMIKADPGRIRQVLTNLVGNAIKFTQKGEVLIRISQEEFDENRWQLQISVIDTGTGIPEDKIDKLFDAFSQVDASTTRKYGGTGLGLAIVEKLCVLMGGQINVESTLGEGSSFNFELEVEKSTEVLPSLPHIDIEKLDLLVVDDNVTNCEVLSKQLAEWGAIVSVASCAKDALQICESRYDSNQPLFDVAFLDMEMPHIDGLTLGETLNTDSRFETIGLVMMTSVNFSGEAKIFAESGFSAYFSKPVTPSDLFNALNIVAEGGLALKQAAPLVTHQYIKSLDSTDHGYLGHGIRWSTLTRVLLVEDNHINQEVAMGLLEDMNVIVSIASNGLEALGCLNSAVDNRYSLVLMDCQMPEMDGYEATRQIRSGAAGEENREIPIIAMTANAMVGDREKCLDAGMSDYLAKPIDFEPLLAKLHQWLPTEEGNKKNPESSSSKVISNNLAANDGQNIWDKEAALKRVKGKPERLIALIEMYLEDCSTSIQDVENALNAEDAEALAHVAHTIKGVSGNLGGLRLQKISASIEVAAKDNDLILARELSSELKDEVINFEEIVKRYCSQSDVG